MNVPIYNLLVEILKQVIQFINLESDVSNTFNSIMSNKYIVILIGSIA
jgi:hypothetical protein